MLGARLGNLGLHNLDLKLPPSVSNNEDPSFGNCPSAIMHGTWTRSHVALPQAMNFNSPAEGAAAPTKRIRCFVVPPQFASRAFWLAS